MDPVAAKTRFSRTAAGRILPAVGLAVCLTVPAHAGPVSDTGRDGAASPRAEASHPAPLPRRALRRVESPLCLWGDAVQKHLRRAARLFPSARSLPAPLRDKDHADYAVPFKWVPRSWTSYQWGDPKLIVGNQRARVGRSPKPIGERGSFQVSRYPRLPMPLCWVPLYFSFTSHSGWHARFGARWDDVDSYTSLPSFAVKKIP